MQTPVDVNWSILKNNISGANVPLGKSSWALLLPPRRKQITHPRRLYFYFCILRTGLNINIFIVREQLQILHWKTYYLPNKKDHWFCRRSSTINISLNLKTIFANLREYTSKIYHSIFPVGRFRCGLFLLI